MTARNSNHVWYVDLTAVPTSGGYWVQWLPSALPQCWPFCWWVAVLVDHLSRRVMGFAVFTESLTSAAVRTLLARTIYNAGAAPK